MKKNLKDLGWLQGIQRSSSLFGLFYVSFFAMLGIVLNAQPTVREVFTLPSTLITDNDRRDWIFDMDMAEDCDHVYFCGYSSPGPHSHTKRGHAVVGKLNPETKQIVWEKLCNIAQDVTPVEGPIIDLSWSAFENITEVGNDVIAIGTESYVTEYELVNGQLRPKSSIRRVLYAKLSSNGDFIDGPRYLDMDPSTQSGRGNAVLGLSNGSSLVAGNINPNDVSTRKAAIIKLDANGNKDNSFSYAGPLGGNIENIIEITGPTSIKYVTIGTITVGTGENTNSDVFIEAINSSGGREWIKQFTETNHGASYTDVEGDIEKLDYCKQSTGNTTLANSDDEQGYDIIFKNGALYFTAKFDYFDDSGNYGECTPTFYIEFDLAFGKMNLEDGTINSLKNIARMGGEDFKPRINYTNGSFYIPGLQLTGITSDNPPVTTFTDIVVIADDNGDLVGTKVTQEGAGVGCPFAIITDCDGNILIGGDKEVTDVPYKDDDYYFVKLIFPCQNSVNYSGNDIVINTPINSTISWSTSRKVKATVTINNGGNLTIDGGSVIEFASAWEIVDFNELSKNDPNSKVPRIVVMPGGTLTIDGATLKGLYACNKDWMWEGIEVKNGGHIILTNEAKILDAKLGILVGNGSYNFNGNFNPTNTGGGGLVTSSGNSSIENCRRGVHFSPASGSNGSSFSNTHFLCTGGLKDEQFKSIYTGGNPPASSIIYLGTKEFVSMYDIKGIGFSTCEFSNTRPSSFPAELRGTGIGSYDAEYSITSTTEFKDLNIGVQGLNGTNSTRFIRIAGSNQFKKNQIGVRFVGGRLHQIKTGNNFELNPSAFVYNQFFTLNPILGVSNSGSTKIEVRDNTFDGITSFSTSDPLKFGFMTDNTNSPSFHLKNTFTKLYMGEQMQKDNTGMQLYCNEHTLFKNAWTASGKMSSQGYCGSLPSSRLTPDDKFNIACLPNGFAHINSSATFTYFEKSGFTGNPNPSCVTTQVTINNNNCNGDEPSGCSFNPPELTPGNVVSYRTQADGMADGPHKDVIVNALLRYYYGQNQTEDATSLLASQSGDNYKFDHALILTNAGNYSGANSVINSIPSSSDEKSDIQAFMNVIISAKQNNIPLYGLSTSAVNTLISIADDRTLGAYAAQALLMAYYDKDYLIPIETNQGIGFRSKANEEVISEDKVSLSFIPAQVNDQLTASIRLNSSSSNVSLIIYSAEGKQLFQRQIKSTSNVININTSDWPTGIFYGVISDNEGIIANSRGIKK